MQKKWSEVEQKLLLDFVLENVDIEKPTSTIYYQKCLDQTKIDATCEMLRCKVRYWKATFNKAEEWRKSTGAGIDANDDCSTIKDKLQKMCPYYDRLAELFHNKSNSNVVTESSTFHIDVDVVDIIEEDGDVILQDSSFTDTFSPSKEHAESVSFEPMPQAPASTSTPIINRSLGQKFKTRMQKSSLSQLAEIQKKRDAFYEKRLCIEQQKVDLEKSRMEQEFQIRKLELEQNERLAIMEVKFKYNKE